MKCKFEPFERDSKHSNATSKHSKVIGNIRMQIRAIRKGFEAFKCKFEPFEGFRSILMKFEPFERDSKHSNGNANHSKGIRSILIQILTIRKKFEVFKCKFEPFKRDWKHSNSNSNHSKCIRSIEMQILTTRTVFEAF